MQEKMTAETAVVFERGYSLQNSIILAQASESRGCTCEPYRDWFTYNRWSVQGFQVQKGEHGVKLSTFVPVTKKVDGEDKVTGSRPWTTTVFCRCQVKEKTA